VVGMLTRGADERWNDDLDLDRLAMIQRFAERWLRFGGHVTTLQRVLTDVTVTSIRRPAEEIYDLFGVVGGLRNDWGEWRWGIKLNDALPIAAAHAVLGHEYTHVFQLDGTRDERVELYCEPYGELPPLEREAHVGSSLWTVPFARVARLALGDTETAVGIALDLQVPTTSVLLRNTAAVLLGEKAGNRRAAQADLNSALLEHQVWMSKIAQYLAARARIPQYP
jgi:hypothetical protein